MRTSIDARANLHLIEENYRRWQENPDSVDSGWSAFFEGFELGNLPEQNGAASVEAEARDAALQTRVDSLVYAYCSLGHTIARIDPLAETRPTNPLLGLSEFGFTDSDLDPHIQITQGQRGGSGEQKQTTPKKEHRERRFAQGGGVGVG